MFGLKWFLRCSSYVRLTVCCFSTWCTVSVEGSCRTLFTRSTNYKLLFSLLFLEEVSQGSMDYLLLSKPSDIYFTLYTQYRVKLYTTSHEVEHVCLVCFCSNFISSLSIIFVFGVNGRDDQIFTVDLHPLCCVFLICLNIFSELSCNRTISCAVCFSNHPVAFQMLTLARSSRPATAA